jgi:hypothetical protein
MILLDFPMVSYIVVLMKPTEIVPAFDAFLNLRNLKFEAVVIGGAALSLLGVIIRETRDCDILSPEIPKEILEASKDFAKSVSGVDTNWLNNGPSSLLKTLPKDWNTRTQSIFQGGNLRLFTLGRPDLLKTKLFAFCDRDIDLEDCIRLAPSKEELVSSIAWVKDQDANPKWPERVDIVLQNLATRLGYEL